MGTSHRLLSRYSPPMRFGSLEVPVLGLFRYVGKFTIQTAVVS
jgi:hypothetical protein